MTNLPHAIDPPRTVTSATRYDAALLESLDAQVQALGLEAVRARNASFAFAYAKADPDGGTLEAGAVVALKEPNNGEALIVPATAANVSAGARAFGVLTETTPPGARGRVAVAGLVPRTITALAAGDASAVVADDITAALARSVDPTGAIVGYCTTTGEVVLTLAGGGGEAGASAETAIYVESDGDPIELTALESRAKMVSIGGSPADTLAVSFHHTARGLRVISNETEESLEIVVSLDPLDLGEPVILTPITLGAGETKILLINAGGGYSWYEPPGAFDPASPGAIGGTTPGPATFDSLSVLTFAGLGESYVLSDNDGGIYTRAGVPVVDLTNAGGTAGDTVRYTGSVFERATAAERAGTYANRPVAASKYNGQRYAATDSPVADWVCVSGVWRPIVDGVVGTEVPTAGWSWVNQGSATLDDSKGALYLSAPAGTPTNQRLRVRTAPGTPYTITACITLGTAFSTTASCYAAANLAFRESSSGKVIPFGFSWNYNAGSSFYGLYINKMNSASSYSSTYIDYRAALQHKIWLRIADTGANRVCSWSPDGVNFHTVHTVGRTDFLTADQVGFGVDAANASASISVLSWGVS